MKTEVLNKHIELLDFDVFSAVWGNLKKQLTEREIQDFLCEVVEEYYTESHFLFFRKVIDKVSSALPSLDFSIDHWAPTFLTLAVHVNSQMLFDHLIEKGANINFIGDNYFGETAEVIQSEVDEMHLPRYETCYDFAVLKKADMLTVEYQFKQMSLAGVDINSIGEEVTISKEDYISLVNQSQYLKDLIQLDKLVGHIKALGGKRYIDLA